MMYLKFYKLKKDNFLIFKDFSVKNEVFEVLETEKGSFLIFKDFFDEE